MKKFFSTPMRIYAFVIGTIVDTFSFVLIIKQTQFKMLLLISSPWLWLFVIVSFTLASLFLYFKWQDYKAKVEAQIRATQDELTEYRKGVHKEFGRVYNEISTLYDRNNKLVWQLEEIKNLSKADHSV